MVVHFSQAPFHTLGNVLTFVRKAAITTSLARAPHPNCMVLLGSERFFHNVSAPSLHQNSVLTALIAFTS